MSSNENNDENKYAQTKSENENKIISKTWKKSEKTEDVADFERAMETAGFGRFNWCLVLVGLFSTCATSFETTTMSYILPIAECDLMLTLRDKGVLNAATYAGMIVSAIFWGYLADTQGRRKLLVICFLGDAICVLASSLSQNTEMLITFKFFGGIMVNGPSAILYTYVTELHTTKNRPRSIMMVGILMSFATIMLPLLAWAIFPRAWNFVLFSSLYVHSWQIFLFVCALPSLISGFSFMLLPESPKFLMSQGRNAEALRTFQKIFAINTRKPKEDYPIKQLVEEVPSRDGNANEVIFTIDPNKTVAEEQSKKIKRPHRSFSESLHDGMQQIKPLFRKPLLGHAIHVLAMQFCILLSLNTIRLWLPQLFASISEYEAIKSPEDSANLCTILEYSVNNTATMVTNYEEKCSVRPTVSMNMYINNIIVASSGMVGYAFGGTIVRIIGAKRLMVYGLLISSALGISLYWSINSLSTLIISSLYLTVSSVSTMSLLNTMVAIFPTSLRTLIIAIGLMFGRLGALTGNMIFPLLIEWGCLQPFLMVGLMLLLASGLACILPSAKKQTFT